MSRYLTSSDQKVLKIIEIARTFLTQKSRTFKHEKIIKMNSIPLCTRMKFCKKLMIVTYGLYGVGYIWLDNVKLHKNCIFTKHQVYIYHISGFFLVGGGLGGSPHELYVPPHNSCVPPPSLSIMTKIFLDIFLIFA